MYFPYHTLVQNEYLPVSKKKVRAFMKKYLPIKIIGGRIFTDRASLEAVLSDPNTKSLPLN